MEGIDTNVLPVVGAYGRDATLHDWVAGKDFQIMGGPYMSVRDRARLVDDGFTAVWLINQKGELVAEIPLNEQ